MDLHQALADFQAKIPLEGIVQEICTRNPQFTPEEVRQKLNTYVQEMPIALRLVQPFLQPDQRILEVGAGLCLFSFFLKQQGYAIWALEPDLGGFGFFSDLRAALLKRYAALNLPLIPKPAEAVHPAAEGQFDLIFSLNVLEHIPRYREALCQLADVLTPRGLMVHSCPNYRIPYEPHFQIPVLKAWPKLSERLFSKRIAARRALWESLNFISAGDLQRVARECHLQLKFQPSPLTQVFQRLQEGPVFAERHGRGWVRLTKALQATGLLFLLQRIPPTWSTPMTWVLRREMK